MNVSSRVLKAHLWAAWAVTGGAQAPTPLQPYLQSQAAQATALVAAGQIRSNVSNGHTTEFGGHLDSPMLIQIWAYLSDLFDTSTQELVDAGTATPTDTQVKAQMELNLRPITGTTDNFMYLVK